jgi:O-antigen/teichoic acid export membrane protein
VWRLDHRKWTDLQVTLRHKAIAATLWSAVQNLGVRLIGLVVLLVLARLLAPEDFGLVALVAVVLALFQLLVEQGFEDAIVQRSELRKEHLDTAFWVSALLGLVSTCILASAASLVARLLNEPRLAAFILVVSPTLLITSLSRVQLGLLRRELAFRSLAYRQLIAAGIGGVIGIGMALEGFGAWSLIGRQLAETVVSFGVLWRVSHFRPGTDISWRHFKELFRYGSNLTLTQILGFLSVRADSLVVHHFLGPVALGYYSIGQRLFQFVMDVIQSPVNQVAFTLFSRLQQDSARVAQAFLQAVRFTSLIAFPIFTILAILNEEVVLVVLGPKWTEASTLVQVLALGGLLIGISYFNATVIKAMGKPSWVLFLVALNGVANIAGFLLAVRWGIAAVAAAFVIRAYAVYPLNFFLTQRLIPITLRGYLREIAPAFISSVAAAAATMAAAEIVSGLSAIWRLVISASIGAAAYTAVLHGAFPAAPKAIIEMTKALMRPK